MKKKGSWIGLCGMLVAVVGMILDVALFWTARLQSWWHSNSVKDRLVHCLATATTFEDWEEAAFELDELQSTDLWRQNPTSREYDYRLILGRLEALMRARENGDILMLVNLLRSGLVRNLGNITSPKLFIHAYAGTKVLIDDYITQVALSIQHVTFLQTGPTHESGFTSQAKLELLHDTRQAFGRTTLLLQGGSIFGLCHIGIVKALHLHGLLPRIITGTAAGALIAALVGIHTEDELLTFLDSDAIDLSAFERRQREGSVDSVNSGNQFLSSNEGNGWLETMIRRVKRYLRRGYFLDVEVLEECMRANVGDLTFEEAYARSKRILNITVAVSGKNGTPTLLNYLTAPNVLIWSAAVASNASSTTFYSPVTIYCKDETGSIAPWPHTQDATFRSYRHVHHSEGESSLSRIAELFNVNHFIVSRARPYFSPFLRSELSLLDRRQADQRNLSRSLIRLMMAEIRHRLKQLDYIGLLPRKLYWLLIDENIPGPNLTLLPDLTIWDFPHLFRNPTQAGLAYWILKGERGVWPAISALKVRCAIEVELDKAYQIVRRRRPSDPTTTGGGVSGAVNPVFQDVSTPPARRLAEQYASAVASEGVPRRRRASSSEQVGPKDVVSSNGNAHKT